jgi:predicted thioredoxin/glutaredoxin
VIGRFGQVDLQGLPFVDCEFQRFEGSMATTQSVMNTTLPIGVRVLVSVLKKIYERRGDGRKEGGLSRGLELSVRHLVPSILQILRSEGLVSDVKKGTETVWVRVKAQQGRVGRIIAAPNACNDDVVVKARRLN